MFTGFFKNWKTTSIGLAMILGVIVHLSFGIKNGTVTESDVTLQIPVFLGGLGFLFTRDNNVTSSSMGLSINRNELNTAMDKGDAKKG